MGKQLLIAGKQVSLSSHIFAIEEAGSKPVPSNRRNNFSTEGIP